MSTQTAPISSLGFPSAKGPASPADKNSPTNLKADFLTLLVAQIQHQDPLNPQDPQQFTTQLAQFSSLEQLVSINSALGNQSKDSATAIGASAASFIGKTAEVISDKIDLKAGSAGEIRYIQSSDSASTTVNIYDSADRLVRKVDLGPTNSGHHEFQWDGLTTGGSTATDGTYRVEVKPKDAGGNDVITDVTSVGRITGVKFVNGVVYMEINGGNYTLSDLLSLREGETATTPSDSSTTSQETAGSQGLISKLLPI